MRSLIRNPRFVYPMLLLILLALFVGMASFFAAKPANASGSDGTTPYTVSADGIQLPAGDTFADGGHVNIETNLGDAGIHFEALNNQPSGQWIGESFLPWSAFGFDSATLCVSWVQVWLYPEHFGEGGQEPVGIGCVVTEEPTSSPTPEPTVEPTPEPTVIPTTPAEPEGPPFICSILDDPQLIASGWLTPDEWLNCGCPPVPEGIPTPELIVGECPAVTPTPTATAVAPVVDVPSEPTASNGAPQLAETGSHSPIPTILVVLGVIVVGFFLVTVVIPNRRPRKEARR